ncbi:hypothetical protein D3C72_693700 [compost metagenome]
MRIITEEITQIVKHLFDNVVGDALNHSLFLCQWNKFSGAHHLTVKSGPAQQRFGTHTAVIFNINDRLIVNAQLALIKCAMQ